MNVVLVLRNRLQLSKYIMNPIEGFTFELNFMVLRILCQQGLVYTRPSVGKLGLASLAGGLPSLIKFPNALYESINSVTYYYFHYSFFELKEKINSHVQ